MMNEEQYKHCVALHKEWAFATVTQLLGWGILVGSIIVIGFVIYIWRLNKRHSKEMQAVRSGSAGSGHGSMDPIPVRDIGDMAGQSSSVVNAAAAVTHVDMATDTDLHGNESTETLVAETNQKPDDEKKTK